MITSPSKCTHAGAANVASLRRPAATAAIVTLLLDLLSTWFERACQRRQLHLLDDRMLKDIGLTRADVEYEVQKRFWMR